MPTEQQLYQMLLCALKRIEQLEKNPSSGTSTPWQTVDTLQNAKDLTVTKETLVYIRDLSSLYLKTPTSLRPFVLDESNA